MGTRRGAAERSGRGAACAQDALKAPRMAQEAIGGPHECLRPSPRSEAVLSDCGVSGGNRRASRGMSGETTCVPTQPKAEGPSRLGGAVGPTNVIGPRVNALDSASSVGRSQNEASMPRLQPAHQTSVFHPVPLSWPDRHPFDASRIDDKGRWIAATSRFLVLVNELCRKYRKEFPSVKYGVTAMGGLRERLSLLQQFGGLPKSVESLNGVPAEKLEEAVEAFAHYFGLTGNAATGNLDGTPSAADLDPAPRKRRDLEVPW